MMNKMVGGSIVPMSDDEEAQFLADQAANQPTPNQLLDRQIAAAEAALPVTPRALREFMLMTLQFAHVDPAVNPKFMQIAQLDASIAALRKQKT